MSASILQSQQPFSLPSDPGVHWNANAATSTPGATQNSVGIKSHTRGVIERNQNTPPRSYDAATGGRSDVDYEKIYGS